MQKIRTFGANFGTFLISLVPVFKSCPPCPLCMPKYAALFAFFGLELADYSHYLVPIMGVSMLISLITMYYQMVKNRLTWYPIALSVISCVLILLCKYSLNNIWGVYLGMLGLFSTTLYHQHRLKRISKANSVQSCASNRCSC